MAVLAAYIVPHPPLIIPEVGCGREKEIQDTIDSYDAIAKEIAKLKPDTIVICSPHTTLYADYFHISPGKKASGDMSQFGAPEVRLKVQYDYELVMTISGEASAAGIAAGTQGQQDPSLDHAFFIPLYFINKYYTNYKAVRCGYSGMGPLEHLKFGRAIRYAAEDLDRNIVFIASGDLSHKLRADGPYGYAEEGPLFDDYVVRAIKNCDLLSFLTAPSEICGPAAECGLGSFRVMCGVLDGLDIESKFYSHQGNFGVGYCIGSFKVTACDTEKNTTDDDPEHSSDLETAYIASFNDKMTTIRAGESPIVTFARNYLEEYIRTGNRYDTETLASKCNVPSSFKDQAAGAFVSIKKHGQLRGCIGTTEAVRNNIISEVAENAISAGVRDPRFMPVTEKELSELTYSVDILGTAETIESMSGLDPEKYGVIVTSGNKRGLLLPDLEGVDTAEQQVRIACSKAGISEDENFSLERFEVIRYK